MYDFDNGLAANDAFGTAYGISDLGYGNLEVNSRRPAIRVAQRSSTARLPA